MKNNSSIKIGLTNGIAIIFIVLATAPLVIGYNVGTTMMPSNESTNENNIYDNFSIYDFPEYVAKERYPDLIYDQKNNFNTKKEQEEYSNSDYQTTLNGSITENQIQPLEDPMDSPWPMYCHDTRHTGRSPYSTVDTWDEIWKFELTHPVYGDVAIGNDGTIYFGVDGLYVVNPNGTLKWKYITNFLVDGAPAIDGDGIIYFGTVYGSPSYLFALYPNGTLKWKYSATSIFSSPAIANDGTIVFADADNWNIIALYPNGTVKWVYHTNMVVYSSPAIGNDGTVYCGSHDTYLYALYLNNGTLKWKYKTGDWIRTSPCIADDGTIYVVSLDGYLYAVNPDGSLKWKTDVGAGTSPTIGQDGTIYCGWDHLYAVNPSNGSVKWTFDVGGTMQGGTPCNSVDGTIYFGTHIGEYDGGELIAVNPDGTERWRIMLATDWIESAPAIGSDGTIYVGSCNDLYHPGAEGYLHAIGIGPLEADADGPHYGLINQPVQFTGSATGGYRPYNWLWNFGDGQTSTVQNPTHAYINPGNYTVTLTVTDNSGNTSSDTIWAKIKESNNPPNKPSISGPTSGKAGTPYDYTFAATDPDNDEWVNYYIDWGDNSNSGWVGPYIPGQDVTKSHTWAEQGTYVIKAKAKDNYGGESEWGTKSVTMPLDLQISQSGSQQISQQSSNQLLLKMIQRLLLNIR